MYCGQCGKELDSSSSFCPYCGSIVKNEENFEAKKQKPQKKYESKGKNPWKIIIVAMAFALVVAIVLSVVLIRRNQNLEEKLEAKERLAEILKESTDKPIVEFILEDYDSDGTYEAYAVAGQVKGESGEEKSEYYDADVYFLNQTEAQVIQERVSGKSNGTIEANDKIYISLENKFEDEAEGYSYIYTVDENKPVESETSGKYHEVHQENGKILAKEEINEDFIVIEISDEVNEIDKADKVEKHDNNDELKEKIHAEYQSLMRDVYNNPGIYIGDTSLSSVEDDVFAIADINADGVDELVLSSTSSFVANWCSIIWSYDVSTGTVYECDRLGPNPVFYKDNIVLNKATHNHTYGSKFWPYTVFAFDESKNEYINLFFAYSMEKSMCEGTVTSFPAEHDSDNDGSVYCLGTTNENGEYITEYFTESEYKERISEYISEDKLIEIEYKNITLENIESIINPKS